MALFDQRHRATTHEQREWFGFYERLYTSIDFLAAFLFLGGSICFFQPDLRETGTWLFLTGSCAFAAKPTVRLLREFKLASLPLPGDDE
ncbi:YrhK family protein [Tepidicaulis sp. LMO-SS28]|uniref:YrhK family protein n=1 Tax=Tepidicaulis sp. LMO-SS28 TaxID=3447455 RepID=UPI003EE2F659